MKMENIQKNSKIMIITCTGNYRKSQFFDIVNKIAVFFKDSSDFEILLSNEYLAKDMKPNLSESIIVDTFNNCIKNSDIIFSIGGDGTILSTVRKLNQKQIPVLGIHIGNLGFLAQCTGNSLLDALNCIKSNNYKNEERIILELKVNNRKYYALNDIVVDHGNSGRILETKVYIDGKHINNYESDGIIINTPTGSTGYSLSSGGPIISPELDIFNITPISSHSLSARPIVLSSEKNINIKFTDKFIDAAITVDGQERIDLSKENNIYIRKANHLAFLIKLPFNSYISTLKEKLGWSGNSKEN
ncbi:MAG: NAD(+) kinase [Candidatus Marinimicrobia bacterium]|nr:NAD(+) kinase [Candidatus Neomarinimicrobiota bacterium]|tara:strand:- start:84 stop:989 length:906 start_codon:yes stop_codon:yes gene_type:complete